MVKRAKKSDDLTLGGALLQRTPVSNSEPVENPYARTKLIETINKLSNTLLGENNGYLRRANMGVAKANKKHANLITRDVLIKTIQPLNIAVEGLSKQPPLTGTGLYAGGGLYAAPPSGHGLYAGHGLVRNTKSREKGAVGIHGNLLRQPQALTPQPYSVNFVWASTLPPYYQKFNRS